MDSKLTLTVDKAVVAKAKKYAKEKGRSLSDIIENFLKAITEERQSEEIELSPLVKSLRGSFKAPDDFDYKKKLTDILTKKYHES